MLSRLLFAAFVGSASAADVFSFANAVGDGMILAAAPKQAMVWGFLPPSSKATVSVSFGGASITATVGPDQADGSRTTWRVLLPATAPPSGTPRFEGAGVLAYRELVAAAPLAEPARAGGLAAAGEPFGIFFTSGTTAGPKGVVLSQASQLAQARSKLGAIPLHRGSRYLCVLPLFHIGGLPRMGTPHAAERAQRRRGFGMDRNAGRYMEMMLGRRRRRLQKKSKNFVKRQRYAFRAYNAAKLRGRKWLVNWKR